MEKVEWWAPLLGASSHQHIAPSQTELLDTIWAPKIEVQRKAALVAIVSGRGIHVHVDRWAALPETSGHPTPVNDFHCYSMFLWQLKFVRTSHVIFHYLIFGYNYVDFWM